MTFVLIFVSLSFLSLFAEIQFRIATGIKKAKENYVQIDKPAILKGIKIKSSDAVYYENLSKNIDDYLTKHPEKNFIILWDDALYMTFTSKARNTGPMYANFSGATSGVYPYEPILNEYIKKSKPLILAHDFVFLEGYQKIAEWKDKKTALIAPMEKLNQPK